MKRIIYYHKGIEPIWDRRITHSSGNELKIELVGNWWNQVPANRRPLQCIADVHTKEMP